MEDLAKQLPPTPNRLLKVKILNKDKSLQSFVKWMNRGQGSPISRVNKPFKQKRTSFDHFEKKHREERSGGGNMEAIISFLKRQLLREYITKSIYMKDFLMLFLNRDHPWNQRYNFKSITDEKLLSFSVRRKINLFHPLFSDIILNMLFELSRERELRILNPKFFIRYPCIHENDDIDPDNFALLTSNQKYLFYQHFEQFLVFLKEKKIRESEKSSLTPMGRLKKCSLNCLEKRGAQKPKLFLLKAYVWNKRDAIKFFVSRRSPTREEGGERKSQDNKQKVFLRKSCIPKRPSKLMQEMIFKQVYKIRRSINITEEKSLGLRKVESLPKTFDSRERKKSFFFNKVNEALKNLLRSKICFWFLI